VTTVKINVYCKSYGWLFDDLKRWFADFGALPSEEPIPDADAWICIRTQELRSSPKPERTVVQIHDMRSYQIGVAGCVSLVHPAQIDKLSGYGGRLKIDPIGSRDIVVGELPPVPVIGFFCRESGTIKGSHLFSEAVTIAREEVDFEVLMIGRNLDHIEGLGRYERRAAGPLDYQRITALVTCSISPMIPLSAYEACAAGRIVITTPRIWPEGSEWAMVRTAESVEGLAARICEAVKTPKRFRPEIPFSREQWIRNQIEEAVKLATMPSPD
jgi:hypothetical protein